MSGNDVDLKALEDLSSEELAKRTVELGVESVVAAAREKYYNGAWEGFRERLWRGAHSIMADTRNAVYVRNFGEKYNVRDIPDAAIVAANQEAAKESAQYREVHTALLETMGCTK